MEIIIDKNSSDQRFDRFCRKWFKNYSEVRLWDIYHRIRTWEIKVNKKKIKEDYRLKDGDIVYLDDEKILWWKEFRPERKYKKPEVSAAKLDKIKQLIIYEDNNWIVRDKPYGVVMHGGNKHYLDLSMNDYLDAYIQRKTNNEKLIINEDNTFKPAFAYRLDKDTSWILIAAKTYDALKYINKIIRDREIDKNYLAIVRWKFPKHVLIEKKLKKTFNEKYDRWQMEISNDGVDASTECRSIWYMKHPEMWDISLLKVKIKTWRMHQIRIHLAAEWYPVVGDAIYGNHVINKILNKKLWINRQLLHCYNYTFKDPFSGKSQVFKSKFPEDFEKIIWFIPKNI